MTNQDHREPCKTLQEVSRDLAATVANEGRTREWLQEVACDLKKTNDNIKHLEISVVKQLSDFNAQLIAKTSIVTGSAAGGIIAIVETVRYLLAK